MQFEFVSMHSSEVENSDFFQFSKKIEEK